MTYFTFVSTIRLLIRISLLRRNSFTRVFVWGACGDPPEATLHMLIIFLSSLRIRRYVSQPCGLIGLARRAGTSFCLIWNVVSELGFDPSTLGTEGQHLASELRRQMWVRLFFPYIYSANRDGLHYVEWMRPCLWISYDVEIEATSIYWKPEASGL